MAYKPKAPPVVSTPNVIPMADVMLVLLIIFMVVTPMLSKGVSVDMYKSKNPIAMQAADKDDAVIVAVTRENKVFISVGSSTQTTTIEDIPVKVKDLLVNKLDKTVYVKSDSRARYATVVDVVDNLRASGVDQLGLLTDELKKPGAAGVGEIAAPAGSN
jgi:biopolymer transport protein ExbD